jgi:putative ABC transport system ATP-binding protein
VSEALLEGRGIGRRTEDGSWLLEDVSLALEAGERVAVLGPSGAGKSLLLRALARLDPIQAGGVLWRGEPVEGGAVPPFRATAIYLHQRAVLFEGTVEANLRLPFSLGVHASHEWDRSRTAGTLESLGRGESFLAKPTRDLSGGEAQIVAFLRAIQLEPQVLLLDEPTTALDEDAVRSIEGLVVRWLEGEADRALVWVGHDRQQARRMADRVVRLEAGRRVA